MGDAIQIIVFVVVLAGLIWLFVRKGKQITKEKP
jgi:hypothetical protein